MKRADTMKFRYLMREAKEGSRARTLFLMTQGIIASKKNEDRSLQRNPLKLAMAVYHKYTAHEKK